MAPTPPIKITVLGCGASAGVPLIGCDCAVCTSDNPKNIRTRVSLLVESATTRILIDTSPDLRQQCLRHDIRTVDAILYTHAHADHAHGIDDLRSLNYHKQGPIPAYSNAQTLEELQERFTYCFAPPIPAYGWFRPCVEPHIITPGEAFTVGDITIHPFRQEHGKVDSLGFRFGNVVYSTDVVRFPEASLPYLENIGLWIVDCLREEEAPTHAHLSLSMAWINRFKPKQAILTHMSHSFDYERLRTETPSHVEPAFDGIVLEY